jgi:N6-adenosine-specific RNA methylase IME4
MNYATIVADPPWPYGGEGRFAASKSSKGDTGLSGKASSANRYGAMSIDAICDLRPPAADNAHLYLWFTNSFAVEAHGIAQAWGFDPKTILTWTKVKGDGKPSMKMGYYFRGATEHVLFAVRGSLRLLPREGVPTAMFWPRTAHSVKPDAFYELVERCSPGPFLELFARRKRQGWHHWGNQVKSDVVLGG